MFTNKHQISQLKQMKTGGKLFVHVVGHLNECHTYIEKGIWAQ